MAAKIIKASLCNPKTGRIQSDAFVILDWLVTINEQKRVQEAVYRNLNIPSPNQNRSQPKSDFNLEQGWNRKRLFLLIS